MPTIVDVVQNDDNFKTLSALLKDAGLFDPLGSTPHTLFAPSDEAFDKLPEGAVDDLLKHPDALSELLKSHAISGEVTAADALDAGTLTTLSGREVTVSGDEAQLTVDRASVLKADVMADNGALHVIDRVLLPL